MKLRTAFHIRDDLDLSKEIILILQADPETNHEIEMRTSIIPEVRTRVLNVLHIGGVIKPCVFADEPCWQLTTKFMSGDIDLEWVISQTPVRRH